MKAYKTYKYLKEKIKRNNQIIESLESENKSYEEMINEILDEKR